MKFLIMFFFLITVRSIYQVVIYRNNSKNIFRFITKQFAENTCDILNKIVKPSSETNILHLRQKRCKSRAGYSGCSVRTGTQYKGVHGNETGVVRECISIHASEFNVDKATCIAVILR